jgi:hypothetical protein
MKELADMNKQELEEIIVSPKNPNSNPSWDASNSQWIKEETQRKLDLLESKK